LKILKLNIIQDKEDKEAAEVYLEGFVAGKKYKFLLDSGAAISTIQYDNFTSKFESNEKYNSSGVFNRFQGDLIIIPEFRIENIIKKDFTLMRESKKRKNVKNVVGMDLLKDYCCLFQFSLRKVLLGKTNEFNINQKKLKLYLGKKFHPYVDVQLGNVKIKAVWDTGAGISIVDTDFIDNNLNFFEKRGKSKGTDSSGTQIETPIYQMKTPIIGDKQFPSHMCAAVDFSHIKDQTDTPMDMILGYSTLSKAHWLFDFPKKEWLVTKVLEEN
jgi:hypothetical protein